MIYVLIMGLPVFLAFFSDKTRGSLSAILAALALFVPVFFAAVRDVTVGTDVMTYGVWTYRSAVVNGLGSFMSAQANKAAVGYNLIAWLSCHFGSFEIYLGTLQFFTVAPVYLYARRRYPGCTWPAMAAYMLLLFPISLNAMKQMIAVALCLPTFGFIERRRPIRYVACVVLVCRFIHQSTAIVFLILYPVARLLMDSRNGESCFFWTRPKLRGIRYCRRTVRRCFCRRQLLHRGLFRSQGVLRLPIKRFWYARQLFGACYGSVFCARSIDSDVF